MVKGRRGDFATANGLEFGGGDGMKGRVGAGFGEEEVVVDHGGKIFCQLYVWR